MSTTFVLLPVGGDDTSIPSLEITQSGLQFDITCWNAPYDGDEPESVEFENLTANEIIDIALRMLNVVLYSYPEQWPIIVDKLRQLKY